MLAGLVLVIDVGLLAWALIVGFDSEGFTTWFAGMGRTATIAIPAAISLIVAAAAMVTAARTFALVVLFFAESLLIISMLLIFVTA